MRKPLSAMSNVRRGDSHRANQWWLATVTASCAGGLRADRCPALGTSRTWHGLCPSWATVADTLASVAALRNSEPLGVAGGTWVACRVHPGTSGASPHRMDPRTSKPYCRLSSRSSHSSLGRLVAGRWPLRATLHTTQRTGRRNGTASAGTERIGAVSF